MIYIPCGLCRTHEEHCFFCWCCSWERGSRTVEQYRRKLRENTNGEANSKGKEAKESYNRTGKSGDRVHIPNFLAMGTRHHNPNAGLHGAFE